MATLVDCPKYNWELRVREDKLIVVDKQGTIAEISDATSENIRLAKERYFQIAKT